MSTPEDRFDAVLPAGRGCGASPSPPPRPPVDEFLLWLYDVTVERAPEADEVEREAAERGVTARPVGYQSPHNVEATMYELQENGRGVVALVVLYKLGTARKLWPVLYRGSLPPEGANRHPH